MPAHTHAETDRLALAVVRFVYRKTRDLAIRGVEAEPISIGRAEDGHVARRGGDKGRELRNRENFANKKKEKEEEEEKTI
ncbi:unnamed protein product [Lampetra planeri]